MLLTLFLTYFCILPTAVQTDEGRIIIEVILNIPFDTPGIDKLLQCIVGVRLFQIVPHFGSVTSDPSQMRKFLNELQQAQRTNIHQDG